jgi:hypothetical protein
MLVSQEVTRAFGHHEGRTPTRGYEGPIWLRLPVPEIVPRNVTVSLPMESA